MVTKEAKRALFAKKNVRAVYEKGGVLVVGVTKKVPESELKKSDIIPLAVEDYPTDVIEVGEIRALAYTGKYRPAPGGVSIGHYNITAGTLGVVVEQNGQRLILSNNHVLANSNEGEIGDAILQPGPHDGGSTSDRIGSLLKYVEINFTDIPGFCKISNAVVNVLNFIWKLMGRNTRFQTYESKPWKVKQLLNTVDCALALPDKDEDVLDEILQIGEPKVFGQAVVGEKVCKTGRTTEYTEGEVQAVDALISVGYGGGKLAIFEDQILTTNMLQGGDSGSLLLKVDKQTAVGLSFAGSDQVSIHNHINNVRVALGGFDFSNRKRIRSKRTRSKKS